MGGIIGKLSFDRDVRMSCATVARMLDALAHRGPEASGTRFGPGMALAWCGGPTERRRCGDVAGNERRTIFAISDSELSNAIDVRRMLGRRGHSFDGTTDAELMTHAYEEWGDACVARFDGPFACAIWDEPARRLLLARDHVGIRPLCFALLHGDGVVFGSEITALLQDPAVGRDWNPEAIDAYLTLGYVPSPFTMYRCISKLEPAHTLVVDGRRLATRQYWDFSFDAARPRTQVEAIDAIDTLLRASVARSVRDERAGALHSGGVASGAIVAVLPPTARASVAVGVEQDPYDLVRVAATSRHLGLRGEIDLATADASVVARHLAWHFDEPTADPTAVTQYSVFEAARRHVGVALAGHGAAALWAGYTRHRIERLEWELRSVLGNPLTRLGGRIGRALGQGVKGARVLAHLALPPAGACVTKHAYGLFDDECRHGVYTRSFSWQVRDADPFARHLDLYRRCPSDDPLTRALYLDARTFLPDSRLMIADRTATAASLRLRFPFLDRDLIELAASVPNDLKLQGGSGMYALRQLLAQRLPAALLPPARRIGPRRAWLASSLATLLPAVLIDERFDNRGIFSRPALKALWQEHRSRQRDHAHRLWAVLMLEFWFREFIDGDAAVHPAEYALLKGAA